MINCEGVMSSQYEVVAHSLSKRYIDVDVVAVDVHHTSSYELSLVDLSLIAKHNK